MRTPLQHDDFTATLLYKKIIALTDVSMQSLEKLFQAVTIRTIKKNEQILKEGKICKSIFFVEKGYLRSFVNREGIEINTGFTFENNFITQLKSLRLSAPSDTTIIAGEHSIVAEFDKDKLLSLYKTSPGIASFGRKLLEQLLMEQEEHANLFKIYSPAQRYQYLLLHQPQMIQRVSLSQLASYIGVARETLSRIRRLK